MKKQGIIGVDEVGRGSLAGPIVGAAVYVEGEKDVFGTAPDTIVIRDSKKMTPNQREASAKWVADSVVYKIYQVEPAEIDEIGIQKANQEVLEKSVQKLMKEVSSTEYEIYSDYFPLSYIEDHPVTALKKGDDIVPAIAAASIIAKVYRDSLMVDASKDFPQYGWDTNMGYGTKQHRVALEKHGVSLFHRRSFCKKYT